MRVKQIIIGSILLLISIPNNGFSKNDEEVKFGFYADRVLVSTQIILFNDALAKKITEIGDRVVKASDNPGIKYTFRIINDPTINAYSAAGGFVYITTGLLDILETKDELASIIGHEITHTSNHHQINFIYAAHRRQVAGQVAGIFLGVALGAAGGLATQSAYGSSYYTSAYTQQLTQQVVDTGVRLGLTMGNSIGISMIKGYGKKQELEADNNAVKYTQRAGYDPNALTGVFKKLISIRNNLGINEKEYISSLINAEPGLEERIKNSELLLSPEKNKQEKKEGRGK